ncbi:hypothetical protein [Clostridium hydrogeniformans]|uniref:hypothetical protein n=1 Tax=Clostridium hydrogeniformans TaxID=349933 RepID=UPI00054E310B|nr:hypothetical protein [Clostridium hydrogeniformans]
MGAVAFKKMWEDVNILINKENNIDLDIVDIFSTGFVINSNNERVFLTKDHFVDFWCNMLYYNKVSKEQMGRDKNRYMCYIYDIVKHLPYVTEGKDELILVD